MDAWRDVPKLLGAWRAVHAYSLAACAEEPGQCCHEERSSDLTDVEFADVGGLIVVVPKISPAAGNLPTRPHTVLPEPMIFTDPSRTGRDVTIEALSSVPLNITGVDRGVITGEYLGTPGDQEPCTFTATFPGGDLNMLRLEFNNTLLMTFGNNSRMLDMRSVTDPVNGDAVDVSTCLSQPTGYSIAVNTLEPGTYRSSWAFGSTLLERVDKLIPEAVEEESEELLTKVAIGGGAAILALVLFCCVFCSRWLRRRRRSLAKRPSEEEAKAAEGAEAAGARRREGPSSAAEGNTEELFDQTDGIDIVTQGLQEHWVINASDIKVINSNAGKGGFGMVSRGLMHGSTEVAMKAAVHCASASEERALCNEVRLLRRIRHPNVVLFHGVMKNADNGDAGLRLVLEWVRGSNFNEYVLSRRQDGSFRRHVHAVEAGALQGGVLDSGKGLVHEHRVLMDVARAMTYLHSQNPIILHRDLKPANILVETVAEPPRAKVADFGLSLLLRHDESVNRMAGTRSYMAPEVTQGAGYGASADLFSFGCVAFFTINAARPEPSTVLKTMEDQEESLDSSQLGSLVFVSPVARSCLLADPSARPSFVEVFMELCTKADLVEISTTSELNSKSRSNGGSVSKDGDSHGLQMSPSSPGEMSGGEPQGSSYSLEGFLGGALEGFFRNLDGGAGPASRQQAQPMEQQDPASGGASYSLEGFLGGAMDGFFNRLGQGGTSKGSASRSLPPSIKEEDEEGDEENARRAL